MWNADEQILFPLPYAFNVEVYSNRQPVFRRSVGKNLDPEDALNALEWGVLPIHHGVVVWNSCLANHLQLQQTPKPR